MAAYKRIIFKLSGEALKSGNDLFDFAKVQEIAASENAEVLVISAAIEEEIAQMKADLMGGGIGYDR